MSNNTDLKKLWARQETDIPDTSDLLEKTKKFRNRHIRKILVTNLLLLATSAFIIYIWQRYLPEMITTKIGIVLTILAMLIYLFVYNQMIPMLLKVKYDMSSNLYLQQLLEIKAKQRYLQTTMLNVYFVLLSVGIFLYMMEYVARMTMPWGIFAYGITGAWIAFNWFVTRPRTNRKQQKAINELISKFKKLNKQLRPDE